MKRPLLGLFGAVVLVAACFPPEKPPKHEPGVKVDPPVECTPVAKLRAEAEQGSLRKAAALFARSKPCEDKEGALVIAAVLVDLARYEDALKALERTSGPEVEAIRTSIAERRAVRSAESVASAAAEFRRGLLARDPKEAEAKFLHAWTLDAPNGQALLHAALRSPELKHVYETDGATPEQRTERTRVLRLLERAEAELGVETGTKAHAGLAAPPACLGHLHDDLRLRWLADSVHGALDCSDASLVFEIGLGAPARVAQWSTDGAYVLDAARLPRLRWTKGDAADGFIPRTTRALPAPPGAITTAPKESLGESRVLRDGVTSFATVVDTSGAPLRLVLFGGGKELATVPRGYDVHDLDDGRIAVRAKTGVTLSDRAWQKRVTITGDDADVSPDGALVLFKKDAGPWMRSASDDKTTTDLAPLLAPADTLAPASVQWSRVGPLTATGDRSLGIQPSGTVRFPGVAIHDRKYSPTDEVACVTAADKRVYCMDPEGPVDALDAFAPGLICRIGPHVLPLGACPSLVKRD